MKFKPGLTIVCLDDDAEHSRLRGTLCCQSCELNRFDGIIEEYREQCILRHRYEDILQYSIWRAFFRSPLKMLLSSLALGVSRLTTNSGQLA